MIDLLRKENKDNIEDRWSQAVAYAKRGGGIIPGKKISFRSSPRSYVIKAHWGRWIFVIILFAVALVHFLPVLLPLINPNKEYPFETGTPVALFGLFWVYMAYRVSMPVGKITFKKELSDIHIIYGTIMRHYKIVIPKEHVTLKAYIFKGNKPDVRIRYGNIVLSLINVNYPDSELILASVKKEEALNAILSELSGYLKEDISRDISYKGQETPHSSFLDMPKDEWQKLAERSQSKKPFLNNLVSATDKLIVKEFPEHVLIKNRNPWFIGFLLLGFGIFMVSMPIIMTIKEQELNIFLSLMGFGVSLIFLVPAYMSLASMNRVLLKHLTDSIHLKYGFYPFTKESTFHKNMFQVCFYKCGIERANKVKKLGQLVLSLVYRNLENSELVLSISDTEAQVVRAFEKLESFTGKSSKDELTEEVELSSGGYIQVATTSLLANNIEGSKRKYCVVNENMVAFKASWFLVGLFAFAFIMGLGITVSFLHDEPDERLFQRVLGVVLVSVVCGLMILGGIGFGLYSLFTRCVVANKGSGNLYYSPFARHSSRGKIITKLSKIEAIQLCSVFTSVQSGNSRRGTTVYEINAVTNHEKNKRINITCSEKPDQIRSDASAFAEFLGVPLLDHTQ